MTSTKSESSDLSNWVEQYPLHHIQSSFIEDAIPAIHNLANLFTGKITPFWGYEIPMLQAKVKPDFLFCISNPFRLFEALMDSSVIGPNQLRHSHSIYERLFTFSQYWLKHFSQEPRLINNLWFEYDYNSLNKKIIIPNLLYAPTQVHPELLLNNFRTVFEILTPELEIQKPLDLIINIMNHLPHGAIISQLGRMVARNDNHIRAYIQNIPFGQFTDFLKSINYPYHNHRTLVELLRQFNQLGAEIDLDLDLFDKINDLIGLELHFSKVKEAIDALDLIYDKGLCPKALYMSIKKQIRSIRINVKNEIHQAFAHFKIIFHPDKPIYAKAYFSHAHNDIAASLIHINHPGIDQLSPTSLSN